MCSSKSKPQGSPTATLSHINGRPVLQPNCSNRNTPLLERRNSLKKSLTKSSSLPSLHQQQQPLSTSVTANITPETPKQKSPRQPAVKKGNDPKELNSGSEKVPTPRNITAKALAASLKKSKKTSVNGFSSSSSSSTSSGGSSSSSSPSSSSSTSPNSSLDNASTSLKYSSSVIVEAPGSIAAARREQVAILQVQRKMRIAHYGRTKSAKYEGKSIPIDSPAITATTTIKEEKKCSFITSNSDPIYIAYHDEEWGVPVHDDQLLFELLVLTGAQVGSDWTTVLKKRQDFRDAFSGFDPEIVAKFNEKKMVSICTDYGIDMSQVRGAVDNASRILQIQKECGSFQQYLWAFVNHKPIATQYKSCLKIPVKTSKSESISKAMVRRGFRYVGPTVIYSFMQAAGLTNDHLITCPRHLQCVALASSQQN